MDVGPLSDYLAFMPHDSTNKLTRAGLNLIQQALSIFDDDLRLVLCNQRYQEMFALPDELVAPGASFEDTIRYLVELGEYGEQPDPEASIRQRVATARTFTPHYLERERANGRWISVEGAPLGQGGWVAVYTDITEIKIQEQLLRARSAELSGQLLAHAQRLSMANRELGATNKALAETQRELTEIEARTRLVTEMVPAHIAHVDPDLVYTYSNRRLSTVMPGSPRDVVGLHAEQALGIETFARIRPHMETALRGDPALCEVTHELSGRRIRVALTPDPGTQQPDGTRTGGGVYILSTDITQETQARAALVQTRKRELAAQLTSGLAHDFSNLLTVILGLQGKLLEMPNLPEDAAEIVRATKAAARRGGNLIRRMGEISGARHLKPTPTDLGAMLDELALMARGSLPEDVSLSVTCAPDLGQLMLDRGALQDSLLNLILNARDAIGHSGGNIAIAARRVRDTWLEITVDDSGPGFSADALAHGMDPFFTTKGGEGSGLGLAMAFDQVSLAGGGLSLANRSQGGARVTLRLPLIVADKAPQSDMQLVLLVEDNLEIRTHVREMLRALGHQVVEAETALDANSIAYLPEISFVLSDIQLKGEDGGPDLLAGLQQLRPALGMGLMTSLPAQNPTRAAAETQFPVLQKPFELSDLEAFLISCASQASQTAAQ